MAEPANKVRTYTAEHIRWLRDKHAKSDGYSRHRHLYLHDTMRKLAASLAGGEGHKLALLDYGCGKGQFIEEMRKLGVFEEVAGYDPGFAAFQTQIERKYDVVSCLDVLDAAEKRFLDAIVADISSRTAGLAVYDCLTKPAPKSGFPRHPPHYWHGLVKKGMEIVSMALHFPGMDGFERVVIVARPRE